MAQYVNHSRFVRPADHPSVTYLKQDDIGLVLARALADLYVAKPKNQLHFLGNWLLNHSKSASSKQEELRKEEARENLKEKHAKTIQDLIELQEKQAIEQEKKAEKCEILRGRIRNSLDVEDFLDEFIQYIREETGSAACYIGKQEKVKKTITLLDDDRAHIDEDAPIVIRYISASKGSEFMIDKTLNEEEGEATYSVWKEDEEPPAEEGIEETEEKRVEKKDRIKVVSVDDVVNDKRIKFFDVPKLGAYFAVPLTYKCCLLESSFDAGVEDAIECKKLRAQQEEEKQKAEHSSNKEEEEDRERVFEPILEAPYKTVDVKFIVAADTMGQDRVFKENEKEMIIDWVNFLKFEWERAENDSLKHDVFTHIDQNLKDQQKLHDKQTEWLEEEKNVVEEALKTLDPSVNEEIKHIESQMAVLNLHKARLVAEFSELLAFAEFKIVKFAKVFQIAFYLQRIDKDYIVEPRTNMIKWKKAKRFLNKEFKEFVNSLNPLGPKPYKPAVYAKTVKLEKDLLAIPFEDVQSYSLSLSLLYKFLEEYFKLRVLDVTRRRREYNNKVDDRDAAIKAAEELAERRKRALEDAKEAFDKEIEALDEDAEKPVFDENKVLGEFDENASNKPVEIPPEVVQEEDGDIDWDETHF